MALELLFRHEVRACGHDWVELYVTSSVALQLKGWRQPLNWEVRSSSRVKDTSSSTASVGLWGVWACMARVCMHGWMDTHALRFGSGNEKSVRIKSTKRLKSYQKTLQGETETLQPDRGLLWLPAAYARLEPTPKQKGEPSFGTSWQPRFRAFGEGGLC